MMQKTFNYTIGIIFILIAALHLLRSILGWDVVLNGWNLPVGVSVVAFLVSTFLAYSAFSFDRQGKAEK